VSRVADESAVEGVPPGAWLDVLVVGAGGHGREILAYVRDLAGAGARIRVLGFVDQGKPRGWLGDAEILGGFSELKALLERRAGAPLRYITAIGDNRARRECVEKAERLEARNFAPWTLSHPRAIVGGDVSIGEGTCLAPGSVLTTNVRVGKHCIVNVNASISHDSVVGDFANINPGAVVAGNVRIGEGCYIGAGATVIDKVSIGEWTTVGAGAVVVDDIPAHATAVGVPARVTKRHAAP
jgi:sugar O-acyltransferase (sialic acid O-acetyltransferase NeuD family)